LAEVWARVAAGVRTAVARAKEDAKFKIPRDERFIEVFSLAEKYAKGMRKVPID